MQPHLPGCCLAEFKPEGYLSAEVATTPREIRSIDGRLPELILVGYMAEAR